MIDKIFLYGDIKFYHWGHGTIQSLWVVYNHVFRPCVKNGQGYPFNIKNSRPSERMVSLLKGHTTYKTFCHKLQWLFGCVFNIIFYNFDSNGNLLNRTAYLLKNDKVSINIVKYINGLQRFALMFFRYRFFLQKNIKASSI